MPQKNKNPKSKFNPNFGKNPRGKSLADNITAMKFCWRLSDLDWGGPWSWSNIDATKLLKDVIPKLHDFESMTWAQIDGPSGSHFIEKHKFIKAAQDRMSELELNYDELFSLRMTGGERILGWRDVAILRILWWDPNHQVCPAPKKHT